MNWIIELIERIPDILVYLIPGYIFISLFNFIAFKDKDKSESQTNLILLKSIAISYVFKIIYDKIISVFPLKQQIDDLLYAIILIIVVVIFAYILGLICHTTWFNNILLNIGIHRTINDDIWLDIIQKNSYLRVYSKDGMYSYLGMCEYHEKHCKEPMVVLYQYQILDEYGDVAVDYSKDKSRQIVLNLKDFERVEVIKAEKAEKNCKQKSEKK